MDTNLFSEGSIYYYENISSTKCDYKDETKNHDFITSRPVYIIDSNQCEFFNKQKVNILVITSSTQRIGIDINIDGTRSGKVLPYSIYSVSPENLVKYLGQVSPSIKKDIRNAVKYHLGFTEEKPKYLIDYEHFINKRNEFIKKLTLKEKGLYDLLNAHCKFKDLYYVTYDEFFTTYKKRINHYYTRKTDFTKALTKLLEIFPNVTMEEINHEKILYGVSIKTNIHKMNKTRNNLNDFGIDVSDDPIKGVNINSLDKSSLLELITPEQKKIYETLDLTDKFKNYKKEPREFSFKIINDFNGRAVKRLLEIDIDIKYNSIKAKLKNGESPFEMKQQQQFLVYHMTNNEILEFINPKFYKKGIGQFKRSIKQNIRWMFNTLENK